MPATIIIKSREIPMSNTPTPEKAADLIPTTVGEVAKAIVYIALSAIAILITALQDYDISPVEFLQLVIVIAGAIPVYLVAGTIPKTIAAFIVAAAQGLLLVIADLATFAEIPLVAWLTVLVSAFAAIGVAVVPNSSKPGPIAVVATGTIAEARSVQHRIDHTDGAA